jgi:uncharacterized protein YfaS (alpha-2-macroglobulin family)
MLTAGVLAAASFATTASGHQNPHYRVVARLMPDTVAVGGRFSTSVTVTNTSGRARDVEIQYDVSGPTSGFGVAFSPVRLRAGQTWTRRFTFRADDRGRWELTVKAQDGLGTSRATAHARAN